MEKSFAYQCVLFSALAAAPKDTGCRDLYRYQNTKTMVRVFTPLLTFQTETAWKQDEARRETLGTYKKRKKERQALQHIQKISYST